MFYQRKPLEVDAIRKDDGNYVVRFSDGIREVSKEEFEKDFCLPTANEPPTVTMSLLNHVPAQSSPDITELRELVFSLTKTVNQMARQSAARTLKLAPTEEDKKALEAEENGTECTCFTCGKDVPVNKVDVFKNCQECRAKLRETAKAEHAEDEHAVQQNQRARVCGECLTPYFMDEGGNEETCGICLAKGVSK